LQETYRRINLSLSKIERKLLVALKRFYNKYIKNSIDPVEIIRQQRGGYIFSLILQTIIRIKNDVDTSIGYDMVTKLAEEQYIQFWKTVNRLRMREDELKTVPAEQVVQPATIPEKEYKPALDVDASMIGFVGWTAFAAFNTGLLLFLLDSPTREQVTFMTAGDKKVDKKLCKPLHGRTFYADDPLLPKPPLHVHCRCMLLPSLT
jgi:hypothetical protein